jgi:hypothetical protein
MARSRKARVSDIEELAMALPQVQKALAWGDRPAYQVNGRSFVIHRGPRKDAVDEATGKRLEDVVMIVVPGPEDKEAILGSGPPWFTTPHFDGYNAVLVREAHLGQLTRTELAEVIEDAWLARAPKRLAKEWLARAAAPP